ncbi:MAG: PAS domain S-box protein [Candidatus Eisenbacteria bacterium]|nr:PAS domain S-box protein [Candidatus Eisenbacteria bacterium]
MHPTLERQVKRQFGSLEAVPPGFLPLLHLVDESYRQHDHDREMVERSLELSSQELLQVNHEIRTVLDSVMEGVCGIDRHGKMIFVNASATRICGWNIAELIGRSIHDTFIPRIDPASASGVNTHEETCSICRVLATGEAEKAHQSEMLHRSGYEFPARCSVSPIREAGEVTGVVLTFADITEQLRMETQLFQAQKLEAIGQLAAGIAHEINTPVQYLTDNLHFLKDSFTALREVANTTLGLRGLAETPGPLAASLARLEEAVPANDLNYLLEEVPNAIDQSLGGLDRVATIVRAMKEFSHPGSRDMAPVDLNQAIRNTVAVTTNEWKYVAELNLDLDPELPVVTCYLQELNQVFLNLIVNAAHAIHDKQTPDAPGLGKILLQTRGAGEQVEIRVSDTGCGIPPQNRSRIFEPFFTTKPVGKGTGQGLAIVHSVIVGSHRGTIEIDSTVGVGTTFIVRLPIEPLPAERDTEESRRAA